MERSKKIDTTNLVSTTPPYNYSPNPMYCVYHVCPQFYLDKQVSYNENSRKLQAMQHAMISQNMRTSAGI